MGNGSATLPHTYRLLILSFQQCCGAGAVTLWTLATTAPALNFMFNKSGLLKISQFFAFHTYIFNYVIHSKIKGKSSLNLKS
jgi:hypothetical protein